MIILLINFITNMGITIKAKSFLFKGKVLSNFSISSYSNNITYKMKKLDAKSNKAKLGINNLG